MGGTGVGRAVTEIFNEPFKSVATSSIKAEGQREIQTTLARKYPAGSDQAALRSDLNGTAVRLQTKCIIDFYIFLLLKFKNDIIRIGADERVEFFHKQALNILGVEI